MPGMETVADPNAPAPRILMVDDDEDFLALATEAGQSARIGDLATDVPDQSTLSIGCGTGRQAGDRG